MFFLIKGALLFLIHCRLQEMYADWLSYQCNFTISARLLFKQIHNILVVDFINDHSFFKDFKMLNVRNITYTLKNGVRTVQVSLKVTLTLSLAYRRSFLPLVFTVLSRTLPCLCHSNLLSRSCLALVYTFRLGSFLVFVLLLCIFHVGLALSSWTALAQKVYCTAACWPGSLSTYTWLPELLSPEELLGTVCLGGGEVE